jgi:phosphoglycolate phosphatase-like HAD superfamily hydrolase
MEPLLLASLSPILYLDVDGTLVDNMKRFYAVYLCALETVTDTAHVKGHVVDVRQLSFLEFSLVMRQGKRHVIATRSGVPLKYRTEYYGAVDKFANDPKLLTLDQPLPGTIAAIHRLLSADIEVVIVTGRFTKQVREILNNGYLDLPIYGGDHPKLKTRSNRLQFKCDLLSFARFDRDPLKIRRSYMGGDTELDVLAGKDNEIPTIAFCTGMRSPKFLSSYEPDFLLPSLVDAVNLLLNETQKKLA